MSRSVFDIGFFVTIVLLLIGQTSAGIIYESATGNTAGGLVGTVIKSDQFIGSRFSVTGQPHITTEIGGTFDESAASVGDIVFGAIIALINSHPQGTPFTSEEVVASTTFTPRSDADTLVPLSVLLQPGQYALVIGTGLFGADGSVALMPRNGTTTAAGMGRYLFWNGSQWLDTFPPDTRNRYIVRGTAIPEPSTSLLLVIGILDSIGMSYRRRKKAV